MVGVFVSSLLLLIDGYNVLAPVAPPARGSDGKWLQRERQRLIGRLVDGLPREVRARTCLVFDAADPPRDRPSEFTVEGLMVTFAIGYPEADDLLELLISQNSAPKNLAVISSDNRVRLAASRRGCKVYDAQAWLDDLLDGVVGLAGGSQTTSGQGREVAPADEASEPVNEQNPVNKQDVESWMREFGF